MKRLLFFTILSNVILTVHLLSQTTSPLHQYMNSNSLINRPEIFRDLQTNLSTAIEGTEPGMQLDYVYDKFGEIKRLILGNVDKWSASKSGNKIIINLKMGNNDEIVELDISKIEESKPILEQKIKSFLNKTLYNIDVTLQKIIFSTLNDILQKYGFYSSIDLTTTEDWSERIAKNITNALYKKIDQKNSDEFIVVPINQFFKNLYSLVSNALNEAEVKIRDVVTTASKTMITGNTGVAISQSQGTFAGGMQITYRTSSNLQFGMYFNGEFNKADTTQPSATLAGIQARYASDEWQIDVLGCALFRSSPVSDYSAELGLGGFWRSSNQIIVGAEIFYLKDLKDMDVLIGGVSIKGSDNSSPAFLIGYSTSNNGQPVFQLSYPIFTK